MTSNRDDLERLDRSFWFIHKGKTKIYPYRLKSRQTGKIAFRVAPPGTGANLTKNQLQLDDVRDVIRHVFEHGWSVRMRSPDWEVDGLYNKDGYSISSHSMS